MKINCHIYPVSLPVPFQGCSSLGRTWNWCHLLEDIYWTSCAWGKHQDGLQPIHMATLPCSPLQTPPGPHPGGLLLSFVLLHHAGCPSHQQETWCSSVQVWSQPMALCCSVSPCHRGVLTIPVSQDCPMILTARVVLLSENLLTTKGKPRQSGQCFGSLVTSVRNWHSPLWPVYQINMGFLNDRISLCNLLSSAALLAVNSVPQTKCEIRGMKEFS